ncbi:MAG: lysyl oxidase family protein [Solirubrobacterales bacterium]
MGAWSAIRRRLVVAAAVAGVGFCGHAPPVAASTGDELLPNLVTIGVQEDDLAVVRERGRTLLRFTTEVANRGAGPLEVFPSAGSSNCDGDGDPTNDRDTSQRLFGDGNANGAFDRGIDPVASERSFGCMQYHSAHEHWHVLDFAGYALRREPSGRRVASARKVGFCLSDDRLAFPAPSTPPGAVYPFGPPRSSGCDATATEGISVGWSDIYFLALPGQALPVEGLPPGRYCLIERADPDNLLTESDETDNVRRAGLRLRPGDLVVRLIDEPCRLGVSGR